MDRDGGRRHRALGEATLGFAFLLCIGNHPGSQCTLGPATADSRDEGASNDQRGESRWLPDRSIKLMSDTAYSILELGLHANAQQVTLVTTVRLDAVHL